MDSSAKYKSDDEPSPSYDGDEDDSVFNIFDDKAEDFDYEDTPCRNCGVMIMKHKHHYYDELSCDECLAINDGRVAKMQEDLTQKHKIDYDTGF